MLGILLLYFVGKAFHTLAKQYDKESPWKYVVGGLASYYGGLILGAFSIGLIGTEAGMDIEGMSDLALGVMSIPFGVL